MTAALPQTNPRARRTRAALLAAGLDLLAERPIDAVAIDELVARAGVAKGSFFNHFADKSAFASAVGQQVRVALEERVDAANAGQVDPVMRLAGGMRVAVEFALEDRVRAIIMLRGLQETTGIDHELNRGIRADLDAAMAQNQLRREAAGSGVRFWLGLCHVAMLNAIERRPDRTAAAERLREMLVLGLCGLGVDPERAREVAGANAAQLCRVQARRSA